MKQSFIEYSMSVITARALPDVRDGLKPVHRRILYAMNESGIYPNRPHKKSAWTVGEVIGKYHPHGDSAVYETMVRLAQWFSMRTPLIDGHGNFGNIDGDRVTAVARMESATEKAEASGEAEEKPEVTGGDDGAAEEPVGDLIDE